MSKTPILAVHFDDAEGTKLQQRLVKIMLEHKALTDPDFVCSFLGVDRQEFLDELYNLLHDADHEIPETAVGQLLCSEGVEALFAMLIAVGVLIGTRTSAGFRRPN